MFESIINLLFAFFLGMQHSLEPDHITTVSAIILKNKEIKKSLLHGSIWAIGHSIIIILLGLMIFLAKDTLLEHIIKFSEFLIGTILIILGFNILKEFKAKKIHIHKHSHANYEHIHLHSHAHKENHWHSHSLNAEKKALLIGMLHGIAGSTALILVASFNSIIYTLNFLLIFGLGTLLGMNIVSYLISLPILATRKRFLFMNKLIKLSISIFSIMIGIKIIAFNIF